MNQEKIVLKIVVDKDFDEWHKKMLLHRQKHLR